MSIPAAIGAALPGAQRMQPVPNPSNHSQAAPPATNLYTTVEAQLLPPPYDSVQLQLEPPPYAPVITASCPSVGSSK